MPVQAQPLVLTPGATQTLTPPIAPGAMNSWSVELDNLSPWTLTVHVNGQSYPLGPSVMRLITAPSGPAQVTVDVPPGGTGTYELYSTWAQSPDSIQGVFPSSVGLTSVSTGTVDANISGPVVIEGLEGGVNVGVASYATELGSQNWTPLSPTMEWTNVPLQTRTLLVTGAGSPYVFTLTGQTSGISFVSDIGYNVVTPALTFLAIPIIPGLDSAFTATVTDFGNGINAGTMNLISVPDVVKTVLPPPSVLFLNNNNLNGSTSQSVNGATYQSPVLALSTTVSYYGTEVAQGSIAWGTPAGTTTLGYFVSNNANTHGNVFFDHHGWVGPFDSSSNDPPAFVLTCEPGVLGDATFVYVNLSNVS